MPETREDVLQAVADLSTRSTTPSTLGVFDWVTGQRARRGEFDHRGGPAPWFGLEPVLRTLAADGLIEISESDQAVPPHDATMSAPDQSVVRLRLTDAGRGALD